MQADKASIILRIAGEHPRLPFTTAFVAARSFEKRPVHLLVALYAAGVLWLAGFVHLAETPVHASSLPLLSSEPPAPSRYEDALWAVLRAWGGVGGYVAVAEEQPKSRVGQGVCVVAMWVGSVWSGLVVVALLRMTALHSRDEVVRHKLDRYGKPCSLLLRVAGVSAGMGRCCPLLLRGSLSHGKAPAGSRAGPAGFCGVCGGLDV